MNAHVSKPCKFCKDAGKPDAECTNHKLKDVNGNITCPTLLKIECRYCSKPGHTVKYCGVLLKDNKQKEKASRRTQAAAAYKEPTQVIQKKKVNGFAALCDDSDEDVQEFSALNVVKNEEQALSGWAAVAAKPKEEKVAAEVEDVLPPGMVVLKAKKDREPPVAAPKPAPWAANKQPTYTKRWADCSDSEDEEEEVYNDAW